jgi:hypothetical protein
MDVDVEGEGMGLKRELEEVLMEGESGVQDGLATFQSTGNFDG